MSTASTVTGNTSKAIERHLSSSYQVVLYVAKNLDKIASANNLMNYFAAFYLGGHTTPPTTTPSGDPLIAGGFYLNVNDNKLYFWAQVNGVFQWTDLNDVLVNVVTEFDAHAATVTTTFTELAEEYDTTFLTYLNDTQTYRNETDLMYQEILLMHAAVLQAYEHVLPLLNQIADIINQPSVYGGSIISDTPPNPPINSQRWTRCTDMRSFIWYEDGDSGQWVEDNPSMGGYTKPATYYGTVAQIAAGQFSVGDRVTVIDRADGVFEIVSGGTADGFGVLAAGSGRTANYDITQSCDPRHFGATPNDKDIDNYAECMYAITKLKISLVDNSIYYTGDEIVIPSYCQIICVGNSGFGAKNGSSFTGKAVVRASKTPIGTTPNMNDISQQVRTINQTGRLTIDANNIADYGFYGRGIVAESSLDLIYAYGAKKSAISILTSWFSFVKTGLFGLNSGHNIVIGHALSGETGDIFVNGFNFPSIMSYRALGSPAFNGSPSYDPLGATLAEQLAGSGVILGLGFSNKVGSIVSQACEGSGVSTTRAIGWSVGSTYLEANSKSYTVDARISWLQTTGNTDSSSIIIDNMHFDANQKVLTRNTKCMMVVGNIYRYDNVQTFHPSCADNSIRLTETAFTVRDAYANIAPKSVIVVRPDIDATGSGSVSTATPAASRLSLKFIYRSGVSVRLKAKLSQVLGTAVVLRVTSDASNEEFNITDSLNVGLSQPRTDGNWYTISVTTTSEVADVIAFCNIVRQVSPWANA